MICIYRILNTVNQKFYIGQTIDFDRRKTDHMRNPPPKMKEDVELYGWDKFVFEPIEECTVEELTPLENYYISTMHPEYNTMPWSDGMPEEVRQKIGNANTGHTFETESLESMSKKRLHVTLTDEHKEKCRQKAIGNKSRSKPVVCVETGVVYPNMKTAAADVGISPSAISCVIRGVIVTAGGFHWRYPDGEGNQGSRRRNVAVIDEDTGKYYPTIEAAAKDLGVNPSTISKIVRGKSTSILHLKAATEPSYNQIRTVDKRYGSKISRSTFVCVETKDRFFTIKDAESKLGIPAQNILDVLEGRATHAGGFTFRYTASKINRDVKVKIRCLETGIEYASVDDAAVSVGVHPRTIANHLRGYAKSAGGRHFERVIVEYPIMLSEFYTADSKNNTNISTDESNNASSTKE